MRSPDEWREMLLKDRVNIQNELDRVQGAINRLEDSRTALQGQLNATNGALNVVEKQIAEVPKKAEPDTGGSREDKRK